MTETVYDAISELRIEIHEIENLIAELSNYSGNKKLKNIDEELRNEIMYHLGVSL